jgi:hypothetical protein
MATSLVVCPWFSRPRTGGIQGRVGTLTSSRWARWSNWTLAVRRGTFAGIRTIGLEEGYVVRRITLLGALAGVALLLPAAAEAATLTNASGTLTYTADAGSRNAVGFDQLNAPADTVDVYQLLVADDDDPITSTGCTLEDTTPEFIRYNCPGVTNVVADAGDGDDILDAGGAAAFEIMGAPETVLANITVDFDLGDGDNVTAGGGAGDVIDAGDGDDLMALDPPGGGPGGSDDASAGAGDDDVLSGRGDDTVDAGDGNDHVGGGPGNDTLDGAGGNDDLATGPGADDTLRGGDGHDTLRGECEDQPCPPGEPVGADDVDGGAGFDLFQYDNYGTDPVTITLDGAPDDGVAGEGDNIRPSVEDVKVTGPGDVTLTAATGGINVLTTGDGADTINSRDGWPDRISCSAGADVANADTVDIVSDDCETVNRVASGNVFEDAAPTVAWSAPASGARLSTTAPTALSATAADDRGIAEVRFLDDERTVCSDTVAPYTCAYTPQGDDVGRNTLVAIAIDSAGQTASAVRAVRVSRFAATLSARTTPRRDRRAPYRFTTTGRLRLPAGVTAAQGCRGTVAVQIKAGTKTVSTRRVKLRSNCTYRSRVTFRLPQRLRPRRLRRIVRFGGNSVVNATSARRQTLRVR